MERLDDERAWADAVLDTPLWMARSARSKSDAMTIAGCCLKSHDGKWFGKLVTFDKDGDRVVVRGHGTMPSSPRCVWRGTVRQYLAMWGCA